MFFYCVVFTTPCRDDVDSSRASYNDLSCPTSFWPVSIAGVGSAAAAGRSSVAGTSAPAPYRVFSGCSRPHDGETRVIDDRLSRETAFFAVRRAHRAEESPSPVRCICGPSFWRRTFESVSVRVFVFDVRQSSIRLPVFTSIHKASGPLDDRYGRTLRRRRLKIEKFRYVLHGMICCH